MALYKLTSNPNVIQRTTDGAFIPNDPLNLDYQAYLAWDAIEGNTPDLVDFTPVYSLQRLLSGRAVTTNASQTEVFRATLAQNTGYNAELTLIGINTSTGACRVVKAIVSLKRLGGNAAAIGSTVVLSDQQDATTGAWNIAALPVGTDFVIAVTGAAATNISWFLTGSFISFTPSGVS